MRTMMDEYVSAIADYIGLSDDPCTHYILKIINDIDFRYDASDPILKMDHDRMADGLEFRKKILTRIYGIWPKYEEARYWNNDKPCSMLEVMVALADRIEHDVMGSPGEDNPKRWFEVMSNNMDILFDFGYDAYDDAFKYGARAHYGVTRCLNREYGKYGKYAWFPVSVPIDELIHMPIWNQANRYIIQLKGVMSEETE